LVECNLAKVDVAGSNPVSRSIFYTRADGAVPKWLREQSAKLLFGGSNPPRTSIKITNLKYIGQLAQLVRVLP
jgi:hypothetical protein